MHEEMFLSAHKKFIGVISPGRRVSISGRISTRQQQWYLPRAMLEGLRVCECVRICSEGGGARVQCAKQQGACLDANSDENNSMTTRMNVLLAQSLSHSEYHVPPTAHMQRTCSAVIKLCYMDKN